MIDKKYCMSHFLAFRYISDPEMNFVNDRGHQVYCPLNDRPTIACRTAEDIGCALQKKLGGGIHSRENSSASQWRY